MKKYIWIFFGSFLISAGLYFFLIQHDIAAGGVSGFSVVLSNIFPVLSVGVTNAVLNVLIMSLGVIILGFDFAKKSIFASLILSLFIIIFERVFPNVILTNDKIINIIFGAITMSLGLAIVFYNGSSTGGTDLIASVLNKLTGIPIHISMFLADFVVVISSMIVFGVELGLYAVLTIMIQSIGIDYFIQGFGRKIAILVISDKYEEINKLIISKHKKGVTLLKAEGGYSYDDKKVVMTVTPFRMYPKIREEIINVDKKAFIFTYQVSEVLGEGFTFDQFSEN
ncbi:YitT family protein [Anaerococcus prevotii]|uniref:Putative membrane protein n=1 Tax=Anaerococcus prevotii ACS-065-V-Col13 TaxID=879305 RepID=F0GU62_9FIRM|nr:YitT family protein [Anaerococcus prevotii]EGC82556.1 putative membrane protein [Anaerococcus prevotii ACS-065-V-Col13]MDU5149356.1 YitT family protein [Anaerococcus prevotii]